MSEESILQQNTIELFRRCGWLVYHTHNSRFSESGMTDLICVKPPYVCFLEIKGSKGKLTKAKLTKHGRLMPGQEGWLEALRQCPSVISGVYQPCDWDAIVKIATQSIDKRCQIV